MKNKIFFLLIVPLVMAGCAAQKDVSPSTSNQYEYIAALCEENTDGLTSQTEVTGPPIPNKLLETNVFLRSIKPARLVVPHYQIYILAYYKSDTWRNYDTAFDSNGKELNVLVLSREMGNRTGCGSTTHYDEHIIINTNQEYLEEHTETGMNITISGKGGEEIIIIPGYYITAFLDAIPKNELDTIPENERI